MLLEKAGEFQKVANKTVTEKNFVNDVFDSSKDKTIIFISHRINSLRFCDRIYYLKNGIIEDEGKFKKFNKQIN